MLAQDFSFGPRAKGRNFQVPDGVLSSPVQKNLAKALTAAAGLRPGKIDTGIELTHLEADSAAGGM